MNYREVVENGRTYRYWERDNWTLLLSYHRGKRAWIHLLEGTKTVYSREYEWHQQDQAERHAEALSRLGQFAQKEDAA